MRAALRQAPNVIAVGELKDRETMELALEAAETGHLVLSTLNTLNAQQTVERFVAAFPAAEQAGARERLARMLRYVISQRLVPRSESSHRIAVFEILKSGSKVLDRLLEGASSSGKESAGLDEEIEKLVRAGMVTPEIALAHAGEVEPTPLLEALGRGGGDAHRHLLAVGESAHVGHELRGLLGRRLGRATLARTRGRWGALVAQRARNELLAFAHPLPLRDGETR